jgi:Ca-activated chloride channel family protein
MKAILLLLALASVSLAQTNVMFIFDASGSMKAKAGGETRIAAAKRAMSAALTEMPGGVRLGLLMYGHRRAKDCTDIELVSPIGSDEAGALDAVVQKVAPKGETPIAAALQKAAKSFAAFKGQQNTIVLITDGIEECRGDPCAAARALEDAGLDLKVHIVGYMLTAKQRAAIQCVTETTGGRYFEAANPKGLTAALKEVRKVVEAPTSPPKTVVATPEPPPPPKEAAGIKCVALYAKGGKEYDAGTTWTVYDPKKDLDGKRRQIKQAYDVPNGYVFRDLPPGNYVLECRVAPYLAREFPLEVKGGEAVRNEYVMDMAKVRFDARLAKGAPAYDSGLIWRLLAPKADLAGNRATVAEFYDVASGRVFIVPAGEFAATVVPQAAKYVLKEFPLKVVAGEEQVVDAELGAAKVRLDARLADGAPPVDNSLIWRLLAKKQKLDGSRDQIMEAYDVASGRVVVLPEGEWLMRVVLRGNDSVDVTKPIAVKAGEEQVYDVALGAGTLTVEVLEKGRAYGGPVMWTVYRQEKKMTEHYDGPAKATRYLPAGSYRVEFSSMANRDRKGSANVTIKAGEVMVLEADLAGAK